MTLSVDNNKYPMFFVFKPALTPRTVHREQRRAQGEMLMNCSFGVKSSNRKTKYSFFEESFR